MSPELAILATLLVALAGAFVGGRLAARLGQPPVLGELAAGVVLGALGLSRFGLDLEGHGRVLHGLGQLGVLALLLDVGLDSDLPALRRSLGRALLVAAIGVVLPVALGTAIAIALGTGTLTAIFLGACLAATSVGITARVFKDLGALQRPEAQLVLAAAVADDVLGLVLMAALAGSGARGVAAAGQALVGTVALGAGFVLVERWLLRPLGRVVPRSRPGDAVALGVGAAGAWAAAQAGLAGIVGAFASGVVLSTSGWDAEGLRKRTVGPLVVLLSPLFFVQVGAGVEVRSLAGSALLCVGLLVAAVAGKLASGLAAPKGQDRLVVGLAMIPRGEVGLIFAELGRSQGALSPSAYSAAIACVFATTLLTPPLLRGALHRRGTRVARPDPL